MGLLSSAGPVSVRINGVDLHTLDFTVAFEGIEGRKLPPIKDAEVARIGRHGRKVTGHRYGSSPIKLRGIVAASTHDVLRTRLHAIQRLCAPPDRSPASGNLAGDHTRLDFGDQADRYYIVRYSGGATINYVGPERAAKEAMLELDFMSEPFSVATADTVVTGDMTSTGGDQWMQLPVGTAPVWPTIEMQMLGSVVTPKVVVGDKGLIAPFESNLNYQDFLGTSRAAQFLYKVNLVVDGDMEKAGTADWATGGVGSGTIGITKSPSIVRFGRQSLVVTCDVVLTKYVRSGATFTLSHATDYLTGFWIYTDASFGSTTLDVEVWNEDAAATTGLLTLSGLVAGRWYWFSLKNIYAGATTFNARIYFSFRTAAFTGNVYIDDLTCVADAAADLNGGMESWTAGVPTGWTKDASCTLVEETTANRIHAGTRSCKITATGTRQGIHRAGVASAAGEWSIWGCWVYADAANVGYVGITRRVPPGTGGGVVKTDIKGEWVFLYDIFRATSAPELRVFVQTSGDIAWFDDIFQVNLTSGATTSRTLWTFGENRPAMEIPFPLSGLGYKAWLNVPKDQFSILLRFRNGFDGARLPSASLLLAALHVNLATTGGVSLRLIQTASGTCLYADKHNTAGASWAQATSSVLSISASRINVAVATLGPTGGLLLYWNGFLVGTDASAEALAALSVNCDEFVIHGCDAVETAVVYTRELEARQVGELSLKAAKPTWDNQELSFAGTYGNATAAEAIIVDTDAGIAYWNDLDAAATLTEVYPQNTARFPTILPPGMSARSFSEVTRMRAMYRKLFTS